MKLETKAFYIQKDGNKEEEYEDAFYYDLSAGVVSIADGASQAYASKLWANILVKAFVQKIPSLEEGIAKQSFQEWIKPLAEEWKNEIPWNDLPWNEEMKAERGSFSTFLGVKFIRDESRPDIAIWYALAVGDCCLFQIRKNKLIEAFPVRKSSDFGIDPDLICTRHEYNRVESLQVKTGKCEVGDLVILATDAFAQWFLSSYEAREKPWRKLQTMTQEEFKNLIKNLRRSNKIRNDDVTLVCVRFRR